MTTKEVVEHFYKGLAEKDTSWHKNLSDSVRFSDASGKLNAQGKEAFIQAFTTFLRGVESIAVKDLIVEDTKACAVVSYNYINQTGNKMQQDDAEVWQLQDDKIVSLTIYFDITEFRNFMRGGGTND